LRIFAGRSSDSIFLCFQCQSCRSIEVGGGKRLVEGSSSSSHAPSQALTCTFSQVSKAVYTIPPPRNCPFHRASIDTPTASSDFSHTHDTTRLSCLRICRPPAATSPSNTSATCPPAVSVPRPTCSWSAPSAPTVSGAWARVSVNKSMLAP
jgi:hypothetical protein